MENMLWPFFGGILIGLSVIMLMLSLGKIAGISGIVWGILSNVQQSNDKHWRIIFLIGLIAGTFCFHWLSGKPFPVVNNAPLTAVIAGCLVGLGVNLGSGCTSGHGVCGIARMSIRSITATLVFMSTAILTVLFIS